MSDSIRSWLPGTLVLRLCLAALVGVVIFVGGRWLSERTFLQQRFDDVLTRISRSGEPQPDILLIGIDRESIARHGHWPFDGATIEALAMALAAAEARAVVFVDPVLSEAGETTNAGIDSEADGSTAAAAGPAWARELREAAPECLLLAPRSIAVDPFATPMIRLLEDETEPPPWRRGVAQVRPSADGVVRELQLAVPAQAGGELLSMPALMRVVAEELGAALPAMPELRIHFNGPARSRAQVSAAQVLEGGVGSELLADKICIVGLTDPSRIGSLTTPLSEAPLYVAPVEIHAAALGTLLTGRHARPLPDWLLVLVAAGLAVWMVLGLGTLRPLGILALAAAYVVVVPGVGLLAKQFWFLSLPVLSYVLTGVVVLLGHLIVQLVRYQDDLLSLLTVLQRTHWLLPEGHQQRQLTSDGFAALARSLDLLLQGEGTIIARRGAGRGGPVVLGAGNLEPAIGEGTVLGSLPVEEMAVVDGDLLHAELDGRFWAVPVRPPEQPVLGWVFVRLADMGRLRRAEILMQRFSRQLVELVRSQQAPAGWLPDLGVFRLLRTHYLSDIASRLEALQRRDRNEREIITLMLDTTQVGLVLADGVGRVLFRNRFCDEVLSAVGVEWDGESALALLQRIAARAQVDLRDSLRPGRGQSFTLVAPSSTVGETGDSYLIQATPFLRDLEQTNRAPADVGEDLTGDRLAPWPDQLIITLSNVTALQQIDRLKSELIEMISFKCRNHMASILVCSDLLQRDASLVPQVVPELRATATSLDRIFEHYRRTADFGIDHSELEQPVPLKLERVVREVLASERQLADRQGVVFEIEAGRVLESALVAERPLRQALDDLVRACLHASRPQQSFFIRIAEGKQGLQVEFLLPECTLAVALKRFPIGELSGLVASVDWSAEVADAEDLSAQAAAMLPDVFNNLRRIGCRLQARAVDDAGLLFRIRVPQLG